MITSMRSRHRSWGKSRHRFNLGPPSLYYSKPITTAVRHSTLSLRSEFAPGEMEEHEYPIGTRKTRFLKAFKSLNGSRVVKSVFS